jgi:hypothetical protein
MSLCPSEVATFISLISPSSFCLSSDPPGVLVTELLVNYAEQSMISGRGKREMGKFSREEVQSDR